MALAPENSALSLELAQQHGADELEFDVRLSADGVGVVVHDATLARICGDPEQTTALRELSWSTISAVDLPRGQRVLTVGEVLDLTSIPLQVELKEVAAVAVLAEELSRRPGDRSRCLLTSFSAEALAEAAEQLPDLPRGLIVGRFTPDVSERLSAVDATWLLSGWDGLDDAVVDSLRSERIAVGGWPLRNEADAALAIRLGVAAVTADDPGAARQWLDAADPGR